MRRFFSTLFLVLSGGILLAQTSKDNCTDDRAYLGIYTNSVSEEKAALLHFPNPEGSLITEVLVGGAADRAGLRPFDYIFGIDDYRTDRNDDLTDLLGKYKAGDQATIHLIRNGRPLTVNLTFGKKSDSIKRERDDDEHPFLGITQRGSSDDEIGLSVSIISNSTAKEMGLRSGDKIKAINRHPIVDWSDVTTAIQMMEVGDPVTVDFEREGRDMQATAVIRSHDATEEEEEEDQEVEHAFLGINSNTISKTKAHKLGFDNPYGSYVSSVIPNTAAERAHIQPFDYIYGVDEYRTAEEQSLPYILRKYEVGDRSTLYFVRKGQNHQVQVTFSSRDEGRQKELDMCEDPFLGVQSNNTYVEKTGVSVDVVPNSTAYGLGMKNGDLIIRINGYPIIDWEDISSAVDNTPVGQQIEVYWIRSDREMHARNPIQSECDFKTRRIIYQENNGIDNPNLAPRAPNRIDLKSVEVIVSDVNSAEAGEMYRRYGVSLSLNNELSMSSVKVATHPEKGIFQLNFHLPRNGRTVVRIYNSTGREIYLYDKGEFSGAFSDDIDLSQNGIGTYYLQVQQGEKSASKRLLVQKG